MTIDDFLDSIGITPGPDIEKVNSQGEPDIDYVLWLEERYKEMLKALIEEQFFHMDYEQYIGDEDKDMSLDNGRLGWRGRRFIESATGMSWEEIRRKLDE